MTTDTRNWNGGPAWSSRPRDEYPKKPHVEAIRYNFHTVTIMVVIDGYYTGHDLTPDEADEMADTLHALAEHARSDPK